MIQGKPTVFCGYIKIDIDLNSWMYIGDSDVDMGRPPPTDSPDPVDKLWHAINWTARFHPNPGI
jgi:hypothetical protein